MSHALRAARRRAGDRAARQGRAAASRCPSPVPPAPAPAPRRRPTEPPAGPAGGAASWPRVLRETARCCARTTFRRLRRAHPPGPAARCSPQAHLRHGAGGRALRGLRAGRSAPSRRPCDSSPRMTAAGTAFAAVCRSSSCAGSTSSCATSPRSPAQAAGASDLTEETRRLLTERIELLALKKTSDRGKLQSLAAGIKAPMQPV